MNNFRGGDIKKRGGDFGSKPRFGDKRGGSFDGGERRRNNSFSGGDRGGRGGGSSELFKATCSACRKPCEVPFRPNSDKPVFCSACFNMKSRDEERGNTRNTYGKRDSVRSVRPEYGKTRSEYQKREETPRAVKDTGLEDVKRQLATIESRLNRILDILNPPTPPTKAVKMKEATEMPLAEMSVDAPVKKVRKPKTVKEKTPTKTKIVKKVAKKKAK